MLDDYLETALWSSSCYLPVCEGELDEDGCMDVDDEHPLHGISENDHCDAHFGPDDFTNEAKLRAILECDKFEELLTESGLYDRALEYQDADRIGHDFWLTRNGHGAGFWDGDYGDIGDELTKLVNDNFGELNIYINEDGSLGFE